MLEIELEIAFAIYILLLSHSHNQNSFHSIENSHNLILLNLFAIQSDKYILFTRLFFFFSLGKHNLNDDV